MLMKSQLGRQTCARSQDGCERRAVAAQKFLLAIAAPLGLALEWPGGVTTSRQPLRCLNGRCVCASDSTIVAPCVGLRVAVLVEDDQPVRVGQVLARMTTGIPSRLDQANADAQAAQAEVDDSRQLAQQDALIARARATSRPVSGIGLAP